VAQEKLEIPKEVAKQFSELFPLVDQARVIENTVALPSSNVLLHKNYMHYLTLAWSNHFSVVISPDIIFYTILCEIADEITTDPDSFRHLFNNSTEKAPIITLTHDATHIDIGEIIKGTANLNNEIPILLIVGGSSFDSTTCYSICINTYLPRYCKQRSRGC
jgi:hypothetical protein